MNEWTLKTARHICFIEHYNSKRLVQSAVGNVHRHFIINAGSIKTKISIYIYKIIHFYSNARMLTKEKFLK